MNEYKQRRGNLYKPQSKKPAGCGRFTNLPSPFVKTTDRQAYRR